MLISPYSKPAAYPIGPAAAGNDPQPAAFITYQLPQPSHAGEAAPKTRFDAGRGALTLNPDAQSGTVDADFDATVSLKGKWRCA
jgi:hypothetical protein